MPPKPKFTKSEIVEVALTIVSEKGIEGLTARELGARLGSSARPIFTVFSGMEELQNEVRLAAMNSFENMRIDNIEGMPKFKQVGMKMVTFAMEKPKLYQLLFMQNDKDGITFDEFFSKLGITAVSSIKTIKEEYSLNHEQAMELFEHIWIHTFGIGALCATGVCNFSWEQISEMLTQDFIAMMTLLKGVEVK